MDAMSGGYAVPLCCNLWRIHSMTVVKMPVSQKMRMIDVVIRQSGLLILFACSYHGKLPNIIIAWVTAEWFVNQIRQCPKMDPWLQATASYRARFLKAVIPNKKRGKKAEHQLAGIPTWHTPKQWNHRIFGRCLRWTAVNGREPQERFNMWLLAKAQLNPSQGTHPSPRNLLPTLSVLFCQQWTQSFYRHILKATYEKMPR